MTEKKNAVALAAAPAAKTLEEHRDYLHRVVRLKLFYLHYSLSELHPEETFSSAIRNRVDIYRKTDANPGPHTPKDLYFDAPAWKEMEDAAAGLWEKYRSDRARFESEAFEVFRDSIDRRCERDFLDNSVLANYQCGSLKHETALSEDGYLEFHIANAVRPHSFYEDPLYLPRCFRALLRVAELQFHALGIKTCTWLNSSKRWLSLFPDEWLEHLSEPMKEVNWSYAWWGQVISHRGTLHEKNAAFLRENLRFPYPPRYTFCSLEAMKKKIDSALNESAEDSATGV